MPDPGVFTAEADRRQAEYYCVELHRTIADLDRAIAAAESAIARQGRNPVLRYHSEQTLGELRQAVAERTKLREMLSALGHSHPCRMHA